MSNQDMRVLKDEDVVVPEDMILVVVIFHGLMIMGRLNANTWLDKPRVVTMLGGGKQINLSPLPGIPSRLMLSGSDFISYELPKRNIEIYRLYCKVTDSRVDPNE